MFEVKFTYKLAINNLINSSSLHTIGDWSLSLKHNMDASFMHKKIGIDMYIRDHEGGFIKVETTSFHSYLQLKEGEAFGLL